jgi:hypothetical protein
MIVVLTLGVMNDANLSSSPGGGGLRTGIRALTKTRQRYSSYLGRAGLMRNNGPGKKSGASDGFVWLGWVLLATNNTRLCLDCQRFGLTDPLFALSHLRLFAVKVLGSIMSGTYRPLIHTSRRAILMNVVVCQLRRASRHDHRKALGCYYCLLAELAGCRDVPCAACNHGA